MLGTLYKIIVMKIKHVVSDKEKNELDQLLWNVLWKPLGLPRDIRQSFKLNNPQNDLIAVDNGVVIGGLVANWLFESGNEIFFTKLGFISTGEYLEHHDFARHGIKFQQMYLEVSYK
jgi:hypothetical protein